MTYDANQLVGEFDATKWAKGWLQVLAENPGIATDEGTMIGWFSNAIMAGYEHGRREEQARPIVEKINEIIYQAAGAATAPLLEDHPDYVFPAERVSDAVRRVCDSFGIPSWPGYEKPVEEPEKVAYDPEDVEGNLERNPHWPYG
jgi:hypothetical protein